MARNNKPEVQSSQTWTSREAYLLATICLLAGLGLGYVVRGGPSGPATISAAVAGRSTPVSGPISNGAGTGLPGANAPLPAAAIDAIAGPLLDRLKANAKDVDALIDLGNLYSDNHEYPKAIEYYQRTLELRPDDVNVRTDMGTAYWYQGKADAAVKEYRRSLSSNPTHPQTLFNLGVVLSSGLNDNKGAIGAWNELLKTNPDYPEKARVLQLIEEAKKKS